MNYKVSINGVNYDAKTKFGSPLYDLGGDIYSWDLQDVVFALYNEGTDDYVTEISGIFIENGVNNGDIATDIPAFEEPTPPFTKTGNFADSSALNEVSLFGNGNDTVACDGDITDVCSSPDETTQTLSEEVYFIDGKTEPVVLDIDDFNILSEPAYVSEPTIFRKIGDSTYEPFIVQKETGMGDYSGRSRSMTTWEGLTDNGNGTFSRVVGGISQYTLTPFTTI